MKVAYFEPKGTNYLVADRRQKKNLIRKSPSDKFIRILNFQPSVEGLEEMGFKRWVHFKHSLVNKYLSGPDNAIVPKSEEQLTLKTSMEARRSILTTLTNGNDSNSESKDRNSVVRTYFRLKYEAFVQGFLYYYEQHNSVFDGDSRTLYFDWGILDKEFGLTIFLNPLHEPRKFSIKSKKNAARGNEPQNDGSQEQGSREKAGSYQEQPTAGSSSETDPQQPPPPPPPTRNDSV